MASGSASRAYHNAVSAAVIDTVTLTNVYRTVRVINRGTADLFIIINNSGAALAANQADTQVVPAGQSEFSRVSAAETAGETHVQLISAGACAYSVIGHES